MAKKNSSRGGMPEGEGKAGVEGRGLVLLRQSALYLPRLAFDTHWRSARIGDIIANDRLSTRANRGGKITKVFISYHHANDQFYKDYLIRMNEINRSFTNVSVDVGDVSDDLSDDAIRTKIREDYLNDSTVTVLLVGTETARRKHIDWELYSSMHNGYVNKQSGILVVNLPSISNSMFVAGHGDEEKSAIYPYQSGWSSWNKSEYESNFPYMPARITDNLAKGTAKISVMNWSEIESDFGAFSFLISLTHRDRISADYDLSRPMRRNNS